MVLKIVFVIAAIIACVQAGGPAAYSISAPSVDHESVGNTHEHTVKGHYGQSSQSDYSSQVQTAHSQSHVQRSSTSNDGGGYAPHYGGHVVAAAPVAHAYAAPSYAHGYAATAPALSIAHAAPAIAVSHAAPAISHGISYAAAPSYGHGYASHGYGYAAPSYAHHSYAAPAVSYAHAAPSLSYAHAAPAVSYAHTAPAVSHSYVASAPALKIAAAPAYAAGYYGHGGYAAHGHDLGYAAHYAAPAPAYAAHAHYAAPIVKAAVAAPALVHTSFSGHGAHYGY